MAYTKAGDQHVDIVRGGRGVSGKIGQRRLGGREARSKVAHGEGRSRSGSGLGLRS